VSSCARTSEKKIPSEHILSDQDLEEIKTGRQIHDYVTSRFVVYDNERLRRYVQYIGDSLSRFSEKNNFPYSYTILYDDRIYANSAPGGFIFLTTGLLTFLENEAQLAAVLAHEIGRVQYSDPSFSEAKKQFDALTQGGMMIGPFFGPYGALAAVVLLIANSQFFTKKPIGQRMIRADRIAIDYMLAADYDPQGMVDFLYKLQYAGPTEKPLLTNYMDSHPITVSRLEELKKTIDSLSIVGKTLYSNSADFEYNTAEIKRINAELSHSR
jgi:predicted Zn-dependent protease